mmetsp:Transcript_30412/g.46588  ORF Transcript_30412/g.46588 Transcript_30412/m.46588 type:complete len:137 (+) Transcript_30412:1487-1897(+)
MLKTTVEQADVKELYAEKFKQEVDFHHKVQFRFEKAFRLGTQMPEKRKTLNLEIIDLLSAFSGYIETDPMTLFYCLYFCIFYHNEEMVDLIRKFIERLPPDHRIMRLLEYIDVHGIEKLSSTSEQINSIVFHMVMY